jgi:hypothetical protein
MANKKYQVFISSTFVDLREERNKAMNATLMADCIPTGMELFVAQDEEQFNAIKKIIDLCDFYVLILGSRYGSINPKTGVSYTEMEYDYAVEKNIPVLVFASSNYKTVDDSKKDLTEEAKAKFILFRKRVMENRLCSEFSSPDDLLAKIIVSLFNAKSQFDRPGWIRGDGPDKDDLLKDIYALRSENKELKEKLKNGVIVGDYSYLDEKFPMHYEETLFVLSSSYNPKTRDVNPTLGELFEHVSAGLTSECHLNSFKDLVNKYVPGFHTKEVTILKLKAQFLMYGLIKERTVEDKKKLLQIYISLTDEGFNVMKMLNKRKKAK